MYFAKTFSFLFFVTLFFLFILACSKLDVDSILAPDEPLTYTLDIQSIFNSQCTSCHSGTNPSASYDLSTFIGVFGSGIDNIPNAIPGNSTSLLLQKIQPSASMYEYVGSLNDVNKITMWVVEDRLGLPEVNAHPAGWQNPNDEEYFHGVFLRNNNWDFDLCKECHGGDYNGGISGSSCLTCHEDSPESCNTCHGRSFNSSGGPPKDVEGNVSVENRGVGAHKECVSGGTWSRPVACDECHIVPTDLRDPGHIDSSPYAEITWGALANAGGLIPEFTAELQCKNTYCHGGYSEDHLAYSPTWTIVDGSQSACTTCHQIPPIVMSSRLSISHSPALTDCSICHTLVIDSDLNIIDKSRHIDGQIDTDAPENCNACHGQSSDPTGAPPKDLAGNTSTGFRGVGAHSSHLTGGLFSRPVECSECHVVPNDIFDEGHIDFTPNAELNWGTLASAGGVTPELRTDLKCENSYCHGNFASGTKENMPLWTTVDGSQAACGTCHEFPPVGASRNLGFSHIPSLTQCYYCHSSVVDANNYIIDKSKHINGIIDR